MHPLNPPTRLRARLLLLGGCLAGPPALAADWSQTPDVTIVQRQPHPRDGRLGVAPFVGVIANDPFVVYLPIGLRLGWFFNESLQAELSGAWLEGLSVDRDLRRRVLSFVRLEDQQIARAQLSVSWTLFAAKGRWFDGALTYARGHLIGGFGGVLARSADDAATPRIEGVVGLGFELQSSADRGVRVELRQHVFERAGGGTLLPTEISLAWVFFFGEGA